jgi:hypothetical protein
MTFNVTEFRSQLVGDGARAGLFNVSLAFPKFIPTALSSSNAAKPGGNAQEKLSFMARAAQLPGSEINTITLPYFGRELKFAGSRRFPDWSITIINDEDFLIRNAIESWMNYINSHVTNVRNEVSNYSDDKAQDLTQTSQSDTLTAVTSKTSTVSTASDVSPGSYTSDAVVTQYGKAGPSSKLKQYRFVGMFPIDLSPIDLNWAADEVEEYQVSFAYQYWTSNTTT